MGLTGVRLGAQGRMEKMALAAPPAPPASLATCATGLAPSRHPCTPHLQMPSSARRFWTLPPGQVRPAFHQPLHPQVYFKRRPITDGQIMDTTVSEVPSAQCLRPSVPSVGCALPLKRYQVLRCCACDEKQMHCCACSLFPAGKLQ